MLDGGVERLLTTLSPMDVRWRSPVVEPSALLIYPALVDLAGAGEVWGESRTADGALVALLGRTRGC